MKLPKEQKGMEASWHFLFSSENHIPIVQLLNVEITSALHLVFNVNLIFSLNFQKVTLSKLYHYNNVSVFNSFSWSCPWCVGIHDHVCEFSSSMILSPKDNIKLLYQLPPACSTESTIQSLQCRQTLWIIVPTGSQLRLGAKWRPVSL